MNKRNPDCSNCHGKGFYMEDNKVGDWVEVECDCEE